MSANQHFSVSLSFDPPYGRFLRAVAGHLADLRQALAALGKGTFASDSEPSSEAFFRLQFEGVDVLAGADQRWIRKCYEAVVGDFLSFLDSVIAIDRLVQSGLPVTRPLSGAAEILAYVEGHLAGVIQNVAKDQSLKSREKIRLVGLTGDSELVAAGHVALRNAFEHHNGVPKADIVLKFKTIQLFTSQGNVIAGPMFFEAGEELSVRAHVTERLFEKGKEARLSADEMEQAVLTLQLLAQQIVAIHAPASENGLPPQS